MRILHLITSLGRGGTERMLLTLVSNPKDKNIKHMLCTISAGGELESELEKLGIEHYSLNTNKFLFPIVVLKFVSLCAKLKPDIVQSYLFLDNLVARIASKLNGVPLICGKRGSEIQLPFYARFLDKLTMNMCNYHITNFSDGIGEIAKSGVSREKIAYVPNGKKFEPSKTTKQEARKILGLSKVDFVFVYVANLIWYKGHYYLLNALREFTNKFPNAVLVLAGDGPEFQNLESLAKQIGIFQLVKFLGQRKDIPVILASADIYISSSLSEGMPGAVMEAMANGLPIIATAVGGTKDIIQNGENGILIQPKDEKSLATAMISLANDSKFAKKLGKHAKEAIENNFSIEKMVESYEQIYKKMVK